MDVLELARIQFGVTTVYHFLFAPVTVGLPLVVAILQTQWRATADPACLRAARFWGGLFLIGAATGVAAGILQEFQFGLNWSAYSRFVGDVFGAPLALEALVALLLESALIGVWVFGRERLGPGPHLAAIWLVALGAMASAYFVLAADAFTRNPVGYRLDEAAGRAELTDLGAVLANPVALAAFPHTVFAAWLTAGAVVVAVSAHHFRRGRDLDAHRPALRLGVLATLVGGLGLALSGDPLGQGAAQPVRAAAAEALRQAAHNAPFTVLAGAPLPGIPGLPPLAGPAGGVGDLDALPGSGDAAAYLPPASWAFRLMVGFGLVAVAMAVAAWWATRGGRMPRHRLFWTAVTWTAAAPFLANTAGRLWTEAGRQPWAALSPYRTGAAVPRGGAPAASLIGFSLLYLVLAVVALKLFLAFAKAGPPGGEPAPSDADQPPAFAY